METVTRLETEPATRKQVGVVRRELQRLGFAGGDRAERLAACAALVGRDELDSTRDLTKGQAGQLYRWLLDVRDRGDLDAAVAAAGAPAAAAAGAPAAPAGEDLAAGGVRLADAVVQVMPVVVALWQGWRSRRGQARRGEVLHDHGAPV